jgi:glycine cleavage system H lipoate-binding protein
MTQEFLSVYPAKLMEYMLAISYLLLFIPFWSYVQGGRRTQRAAVAATAVAAVRAAPRAPSPAPAPARRPAALGWFAAPANVHLHPGHTWARLEEDGLVTVGLDDFGHALVGAATVALPQVGAHVAQGERAAAVAEAGKTVGLLSPIDGTVVAVNERGGALEDPYGAGWLFKVDAPRLAANLRQLFSGARARRLLEDAAEALVARSGPALAHALQDGGVPVRGVAREIAGDQWDEVAREHFLG